MSNDPLLQPYQLKHLTLKNRIMTTSHEPAYPEDGMPKDRYRLYHLERAKAGVAMVMTAGSAAVSKDSPPVFNNVLAYKDEVVPWMRRIADDCHEAGAAVMIQLTHLGRRTRWDKGDWLPVLAAGPAREPSHRAFPKVMEDWDITRVINDFADAAERMKEAGLDGVEFECYGHLLDQFMSPFTNALPAPYGGSLENRARFLLEAVRRVRAAVGPAFPVSVKLNSADFQKGGFAFEDSLQVARWLEAEGVDLLEISGGSYEQPAMMDLDGMEPADRPKVAASTAAREAYFVDFAKAMKAELKAMPLMVTGGFRSRAAMEHALSSGAADLIGIGRPLCGDPDACNKLLDGADEIARFENQLQLLPRWLRWLEGIKAVKAIAGFGVQYWYYAQLYALGQTGAPDLKKSVFSAMRDVDAMSRKLMAGRAA